MSAVFDWMVRKSPGAECKVEWWEYTKRCPPQRKDSYGDPYCYPLIWNEMGNRNFESRVKGGQQTTSLDTLVLPQALLARAAETLDDGEEKLIPKPTTFTDEGCFSEGGGYLYIFVRQRSGCPEGPTHTARMLLVFSQGKITVYPEHGGTGGSSWPDVPHWIRAPGEDDPALSVPPEFWTYDATKGEQTGNPWVWRTSGESTRPYHFDDRAGPPEDRARR